MYRTDIWPRTHKLQQINQERSPVYLKSSQSIWISNEQKQKLKWPINNICIKLPYLLSNHFTSDCQKSKKPENIRVVYHRDRSVRVTILWWWEHKLEQQIWEQFSVDLQNWMWLNSMIPCIYPGKILDKETEDAPCGTRSRLWLSIGRKEKLWVE